MKLGNWRSIFADSKRAAGEQARIAAAAASAAEKLALLNHREDGSIAERMHGPLFCWRAL